MATQKTLLISRTPRPVIVNLWSSQVFWGYRKLKPLHLVFSLWVFIGCFLSGECYRGHRGQHYPTRPVAPSTPPFHLYLQPDRNPVQIVQPGNIPIFMFEQPYSVPLPSLYLGIEFEKLISTIEFDYPYKTIPPLSYTSKQSYFNCSQKKSNAKPAANISITPAIAPKFTESF
ncbi:LOW QUALITY PROTEIN: submaxillary gland androgen-regulated protein 2-like [Mus caroli]|uniref:LOW QUALITY PROTEIN: submaxillary gland androgen-regulated protein 2-like n=1 Tax=Mus caroli TaxID=10089 RepID=A0A6P5P6G7_MUSCR|nr:LOW QUALITY PROTEIN: submaxillary gland androgen-regulated protein 2-like [Mus caroli]